VLFSSRVGVRIRVRIRFTVWMISGYANVFVQFPVVTVALPLLLHSVCAQFCAHNITRGRRELGISPFDISVNLHIRILGLLVNKLLNVQKVLRQN